MHLVTVLPCFFRFGLFTSKPPLDVSGIFGYSFWPKENKKQYNNSPIKEMVQSMASPPLEGGANSIE